MEATISLVQVSNTSPGFRAQKLYWPTKTDEDRVKVTLATTSEMAIIPPVAGRIPIQGIPQEKNIRVNGRLGSKRALLAQLGVSYGRYLSYTTMAINSDVLAPL